MTRLLLHFMILLVAMGSCEEDQDEQQAYFEYFGVNHAWGFQYSHWIIDGAGNVRVSSYADSVVWLSGGLDPHISKFDSVIFQVPKTELDSQIAKIWPASKGPVETIEQHRNDFGAYGFNAFYQDKIIPLSLRSDTEDKTNNSTEAAQLILWLQGLQEKLSKGN